MNTDTDNASKDGSTDILRTIARANGMMLQGDIPGAESVLDEVIVGVRQLMAERDALRAYRPVAAALMPNRRYTTSEDGWHVAFNDGWNACRDAMLATTPSHSQRSAEVAVPEPVTNAQMHGSKYPEWQCFHCGELFNTVGGAAQHFGADPTKRAGCLLKVETGKERGILWEFRELESKYDLLRAQVANGTTEIENSMQEMIASNRVALCKAEEDGYNKGLQDGIKLHRTAPSHSQQSVPSLSTWLPRLLDHYEKEARLNGFTPDVSLGMVRAAMHAAMDDRCPAHDSGQEDSCPPPHVIDEWRTHCSCCPHCCNHPCDGVAAGGMCDSAECDCFDEGSKQHDQL